jgi:hypothetical protein
LPYGLDPEPPSPAVKERILTYVAEEERPEAASRRPASLHRAFDEITFAGPASDPVDVTLQRQSGSPPAAAGPRAGALPFPKRRSSGEIPERRRRWSGLLAAALVMCLAGLAYLADKVAEQNRTIARLSAELEGIPVADFASLLADLNDIERRFDMVTTVAREAYHLRRVEHFRDRPIEGMVYVCGNRQRWYLNVQGLEAPPAGQEYRLWFVTGNGMVDGGVLSVEDGARAELEATSMPDGTHGFAVSLEDTGSDHQRPSGLMVLLGEESVSL